MLDTAGARPTDTHTCLREYVFRNGDMCALRCRFAMATCVH